MEVLKNKFLFNNYSLNLSNEFQKLKLPFKQKTLRNNLFKNKEYQSFLGVVQNKYLKSIESDTIVNQILSSVIKDKNTFSFNLLNNDYEKQRGTKDNLFTYPESFHSNFMSKKVANVLNKNRIYIVKFNYNLCGVKLELGFFTQTKWFSNEETSKEKTRLYQKIIRILRRIIFVIEFFRTNTCNNNEVLKFDLFLVKPEKKLPKKRLSKLTGENINSGYTTFYNDGNNTKTIIIYRDEELEKLVIHEMIHFFFLDFNQLSIDLSKYLNVNQNLEFIPNESYTEFITMIIHTGIMPIENEFLERSSKNGPGISILNTNNIYTKGIDKKKIFYHSHELLFNEILFGYFQCAKILFQYNISDVKDFFKPLNGKKQTDVFFWQISCIISYFFIKVSLLNNLPNSINLFLKNQTHFKINTSQNVKNEYETLIRDSLNDINYQHNIQVAIDKLNNIVFNKHVEKKIRKKCSGKSNSYKKTKKKTNTEKCTSKTKSTYKVRNSLKGKDKGFSNIVLTTRMSLFEL
jgi:hypothetical protein